MSNVSYLPWVSPDEEGPAADAVSHNPVLSSTVSFEVVAPSAVTAERDADEIYDALLRKLGIADMTEGEVEVWLAAKEVAPDLAGDWIEKLRHLGYIDDRRVAEQLIRRLTLRKGQGKTAIAMELRKRRIPSEIVSEMLAERDDADELNTAITQAMSRASSLTRLDRAVAERRLQGFLMRRGFGGDIVREAVRAALTEHPPLG